ncbi:MAG: hypothetical protein IRZ08_22400 [Frankia sp.]|nr:hypothetical protein [Frankia sp.]
MSPNPFGLTDLGLRLYLEIAAGPAHRLPDREVPALARAVGAPERSVRQELAGQASLGLLWLDRDTWTARDPYLVLVADHDRRRARHAADVARHIAELAAMDRETAALYARGLPAAWLAGESRTAATLDGIEVVEAPAVWETIVDYTDRARSNLRCWLTGRPEPGWRSRELRGALIRAGERGVRLAAVWTPEHVAMAWGRSGGKRAGLPPWVRQSRPDDGPPHRLVIWDDGTALLPPALDEPERGGLLVSVPTLVLALREVFDRHFALAGPPVGPSARAEAPDVEARRMNTLRYLASGAKDVVIAARLRVSPRTVRRDIEELCRQYQVTSRFELGRRTAHLDLHLPDDEDLRVPAG